MPALNGTRRALADPSFVWTLSDPAPTTQAPTANVLNRLYSVINAGWDQSTAQGRTCVATLQQYQSSLKGLSPGLVPLCLGEGLLAYLASGVGGWDRLLRGEPAAGEGGEETREFAREALAGWRETLALLESDEEGAIRDPYAFDLLLLNLVSHLYRSLQAMRH